ncbi:16S rRNA (cytidine(1402)-2'-O)-methyltransferase [bacterium]|nr:16S rRNA (cytidine(1402)-2'-O)-methyltransferase [bacterium]
MSLFLVATPIGNLEDLTKRAEIILKTADLILCEDTRHSRILLEKYGISQPVFPYYDFNKEKVTLKIVEWLKEGKEIALVTDSGTPGISDPAFYLVREAIKADIDIVPVPGPCSAVAALVASGLPTDRFCFEGFLPGKKGRKKRLEKLIEEERTIIFFEAPHRINRTLKDIQNILGDRRITIARELTKIHEEFIRGKISEVLDKFTVKGEMVLVVEGKIK